MARLSKIFSVRQPAAGNRFACPLCGKRVRELLKINLAGARKSKRIECCLDCTNFFLEASPLEKRMV